MQGALSHRYFRATTLSATMGNGSVLSNCGRSDIDASRNAERVPSSATNSPRRNQRNDLLTTYSASLGHEHPKCHLFLLQAAFVSGLVWALYLLAHTHSLLSFIFLCVMTFAIMATASPDAVLARPISLASYPVATGRPLPGHQRLRARVRVRSGVNAAPSASCCDRVVAKLTRT
jgi:hypothetical protein